MINKVDLTDYPHLTDYKDDFVLGCLSGLRFSDFSSIKKEDLRDDMLYKKQQKSEHWVVIPLRSEARNILNKRISNGFKSLTNVEFNEQIKTIARLAGITEPIKHSYKKGNKMIEEIRPQYGWITSHTC